MDYDKLIAPAAQAMRPSGIRKFFDLAAEMPECISLGVGEPDFKTPWAVREAGIESLEHGRTRYTSNAGLKELRAEISRYLERRMGLRYDPMRQILVTVGGSEAIDMCIRTLIQPGDEVIIPEPCFVCYEPITTLSGGVPVHVACRQEDEFRLRADALKAAITPRTKLVIKGQTFQEIALFVAKRLSPLDDVLSTATHFVLRTYKKEGRLYQDDEIDERECTVL